MSRLGTALSAYGSGIFEWREFSGAPNCLNVKFHGVKVIYLPRSDFIGTDKIYYTVLYPTALRRTVRTIFNVSPGAPGARVPGGGGN